MATIDSSAFSQFRAAVAARIAETKIPMTDLAQESGVSRTFLYRILDGVQAPTVPVADKIAKALGLSIMFRPTPRKPKKAG